MRPLIRGGAAAPAGVEACVDLGDAGRHRELFRDASAQRSSRHHDVDVAAVAAASCAAVTALGRQRRRQSRACLQAPEEEIPGRRAHNIGCRRGGAIAE